LTIFDLAMGSEVDTATWNIPACGIMPLLYTSRPYYFCVSLENALKRRNLKNRLKFCLIGFSGRILEGIGAGLLQTAGIIDNLFTQSYNVAYGEVIAQNRANQSKMIGLLQSAAGKNNFFMIRTAKL
jgi:hypothetical protein